MEQMTGTSRRRTTRWTALAGVTLCSLITVAASTAPPAGAQSAPVVQGLVKVSSQGASNPDPYKTEVATCPAGKKVVGGGGWTMVTGSADQERVALTRLEPSDDADGTGSDGYIAAATETQPGLSGNWWVQAYALCADASSVPGWNINAKNSTTASDPMQQLDVGCDHSGQRALGTGAQIGIHSTGQGEVLLQMAGPWFAGKFALAQAHEDSSGYAGHWWLRVYAICADTPSGYELISSGSTEQLSETFKDAQATCPITKRLVSAGALGNSAAPGNVALQQLYPNNNLNKVHVLAVENTPTSLSWGVVHARGICVDRP
jgi:hypothetical protein